MSTVIKHIYLIKKIFLKYLSLMSIYTSQRRLLKGMLIPGYKGTQADEVIIRQIHSKYTEIQQFSIQIQLVSINILNYYTKVITRLPLTSYPSLLSSWVFPV